jgi:hypothetical protein
MYPETCEMQPKLICEELADNIAFVVNVIIFCICLIMAVTNILKKPYFRPTKIMREKPGLAELSHEDVLFPCLFAYLSHRDW